MSFTGALNDLLDVHGGEKFAKLLSVANIKNVSHHGFNFDCSVNTFSKNFSSRGLTHPHKPTIPFEFTSCVPWHASKMFGFPVCVEANVCLILLVQVIWSRIDDLCLMLLKWLSFAVFEDNVVPCVLLGMCVVQLGPGGRGWPRSGFLFNRSHTWVPTRPLQPPIWTLGPRWPLACTSYGQGRTFGWFVASGHLHRGL